MADEVVQIPGLLYAGEIEDGQAAHGYQVKGNLQLLISKLNEQIAAYNAMIAEYLEIINTNDAAAVAADAGILTRLDTLEDQVAGTMAEGATVGNVRVGLEDSVIETDDGSALSINGISMTTGGDIGPQSLPSSWASATAANGGAVDVAGKTISYGHEISNVMRLPLTHTGATYALTASSMNMKYFIIRDGTNITTITIPASNTVPYGVKLTFINLDNNDPSKMVAGVTVDDFTYLEILNTVEGWLTVGSGAVAVVS